MSFVSFVALASALCVLCALALDHMEERTCAIPSKFTRILWCKNCGQLEIGDECTKPCSRCGNQCTMVKF
jgi:hypothetical protein